ncbi:putative midasin [Apostichopus japonicus]|uniref:Putative midasin n=1 Tax=Stichopus japonicus TaxID=307972 RepID=A0A2G8K3Q2_STIJA|nr:putative midasin [Apostichopus japonicus]
MCQGQLQSVLLAPRGVVDPAQKTAVKLKCVQDEYDRLRQDILHYLESIGSSSKMEDVLQTTAKLSDSLRTVTSQKQKKNLGALLRELEGWRKSLLQFLTNLEDTYPLYQDLWAGIGAGVQGVAMGNQLIQHGIQAALQRIGIDRNSKEDNMEDSLIQLAAFHSCQVYNKLTDCQKREKNLV